MMNGNNPYEIMGISRNSTVAQVKARYFELARKHHPDKLSPSTSEEDKKKHEEIFKNITNAYTRINKEKEFEEKFGKCSQDAFCNMSDDKSNEDWRSVWSGLESLFNDPNSWQRMKDIVTDTIKDTLFEATMYSINKSTHTWKESSSKKHFINVEVTMEEVHLKKQKKLRLFLKGIDEPIFITLDIGTYPETTITYTIQNKTVIINFTMELLTHKQFRFDDMFDAWDLWLIEPIKLTWADYLCGKNISINYIDGNTVDIYIEPFKLLNPYCIVDKGLCGLGNLYISVELQPPKELHKNKWQTLNSKFKNCFLRELEELYI